MASTFELPRSSWFFNSLSPPASKRAWLATVAAVQVLAFSTVALVAKEKKVSRTVTGVVLDQDENGIVGATVQLTDLHTGKKIAVVTEEGGHYQFSDLEPSHDYEVQATFKGASSETRKYSSFDSRNRLVLNLKISPTKP